jgi:hypothetical protein
MQLLRALSAYEAIMKSWPVSEVSQDSAGLEVKIEGMIRSRRVS